MHKSRLLGRVDYGTWPYGGFTATSGGNFGPIRAFDEAKLHAMYRYGQVNAAIAPALQPKLFGNEDISSTEHRKPQFNNVVHYRTGYFNYPYAYVLPFLYDLNLAYNKAYFLREPVRYWDSIVKGYDFIYGEFRVNELDRQRAYWSMLPRFKGNIDVFRSVAELKDMKDLWRYLGRFSLDDLIRALQKSLTKRRDRKFPDPTLPAAEAYLVYSWALAPMVRDFIAIACQSAMSAMNAQEQFAERGSIWQSSHYVLSDYNASYGTPGSNNAAWSSTGEFIRAKQNATLAYKYNYKFRSPLSAFARYWGLTGTAETLWQLIPWTCVVDMFLTIGRSMRFMQTDDAVKLSSTQYCESTKSIHGFGFHANLNTRNTHLMVKGEYHGMSRKHIVPIAGWRSERYVRRVLNPAKGPALPQLKLPSGSQGLSLAALARCFLR